jgi:ABC-type transporter Mla maintaining outer membrane lipid asymmetry permease subunit MlaE
VAFLSGLLMAILMAEHAVHPGRFLQGIGQAMAPVAFLSLLAKTLLPGLCTGLICCAEGLAVGRAITEVPQATTRAVVRSVSLLFLLSALISLLLGT